MVLLSLCSPCLSHSYVSYAYVSAKLFCAPSDSTLGEVVNGNFDRDLVTGEDHDIIHTKLARDMSGNDVPIGKLNLEYGIRQRLYDRTLEFYNVVLRQNNPSLMDSV